MEDGSPQRYGSGESDPHTTYLLKYVQAASASNRTVMIHKVESLIPVFLAMDGIVSSASKSERAESGSRCLWKQATQRVSNND